MSENSKYYKTDNIYHIDELFEGFTVQLNWLLTYLYCNQLFLILSPIDNFNKDDFKTDLAHWGLCSHIKSREYNFVFCLGFYLTI